MSAHYDRIALVNYVLVILHRCRGIYIIYICHEKIQAILYKNENNLRVTKQNMNKSGNIKTSKLFCPIKFSCVKKKVIFFNP